MLISMINNLFYYTHFPAFLPSSGFSCKSLLHCVSKLTGKRTTGKGHERKISDDSTSHLMGFSAVSNSRLSKVVNLLTILFSIPSLSRQIDKYLCSERRNSLFATTRSNFWNSVLIRPRLMNELRNFLKKFFVTHEGN